MYLCKCSMAPATLSKVCIGHCFNFFMCFKVYFEYQFLQCNTTLRLLVIFYSLKNIRFFITENYVLPKKDNSYLFLCNIFFIAPSGGS